MRKILLATAFAASLGASAASAEDISKDIALSPSDPKHKTPACASLRVQAKNYNDSITNQSASTYLFAAVAPGGTIGFLALQQRKRDLFKARVEQACLTNPPDRSYLDPNGSAKGK